MYKRDIGRVKRFDHVNFSNEIFIFIFCPRQTYRIEGNMLVESIVVLLSLTFSEG